MFNLMIRIKRDGKTIGIEPMLADLERFIENQGIADMNANADTIVTVGCVTTVVCCLMKLVHVTMHIFTLNTLTGFIVGVYRGFYGCVCTKLFVLSKNTLVVVQICDLFAGTAAVCREIVRAL